MLDFGSPFENYNKSIFLEADDDNNQDQTADQNAEAPADDAGGDNANQDDNAEGYINSSGNMNVGMLVKHPFICEWDYD